MQGTTSKAAEEEEEEEVLVLVLALVVVTAGMEAVLAIHMAVMDVADGVVTMGIEIRKPVQVS